jgi:hypothetical protein
MVLTKLKPRELDSLAFLASDRWQEWRRASFIDISVNKHKICWIYPRKKDWGIGRVFNPKDRSVALDALKKCTDGYLLAEFTAKRGKPVS